MRLMTCLLVLPVVSLSAPSFDAYKKEIKETMEKQLREIPGLSKNYKSLCKRRPSIYTPLGKATPKQSTDCFFYDLLSPSKKPPEVADYYDHPEDLKDKGASVMRQKSQLHDAIREQEENKKNRPPLNLPDGVIAAMGEMDDYAQAIVENKENPLLEPIPLKPGETLKEITCLKGGCLTPEPIDTKAQESGFNNALGSLSSAVNMGKEEELVQSLDPKKVKLYEGKALECSHDMAGYKNCCRNEGWGQDIHLAHCTDTEKELGRAKQEGRAVYVGERCAHYFRYVAGKKCISHHSTYCVFPSKMASIIQKQGRSAQLGIGFGSPRHPHCQGVTLQQFAKLDLSKMDFQAIANDLKDAIELPNVNALKEAVAETANTQGEGND